MTGTSPLRKAREEVAVNIAVTGFVSRIFPTRLKQLTKELERTKEVERNEEARLQQLRIDRKNAASPAEVARIEESIKRQRVAIDKAKNASRDAALKYRQHTGAIKEQLVQIRGYGIALGTVTFLLGGMSAAVVKLAGDVRELTFQAARAQVSLETLQRTGRRYSAIFGDIGAGNTAAAELAEFTKQANLFTQGLPGGFPIKELAQGLGRSGGTLNITDFLNASSEQMQSLVNQAVKEANGNKVALELLQKAFPKSLYDAAVWELTATPAMKAIQEQLQKLQPVTKEQAEALNLMQARWALTKANMGVFIQAVLVSAAPTLQYLSTALNWVTISFSKLSTASPLATKVIVGVAIAVMLLVAAFSLFVIISKTVGIVQASWIGLTAFATIATEAWRTATTRLSASLVILRTVLYTLMPYLIPLGLLGAVGLIAFKNIGGSSRQTPTVPSQSGTPQTGPTGNLQNNQTNNFYITGTTDPEQVANNVLKDLDSVQRNMVTSRGLRP